MLLCNSEALRSPLMLHVGFDWSNTSYQKYRATKRRGSDSEINPRLPALRITATEECFESTVALYLTPPSDPQFNLRLAHGLWDRRVPVH